MKLSNQMDLEKQHFIVVSATSSLVERSWILKQFHVFVKGAISMEQRSEVVAGGTENICHPETLQRFHQHQILKLR